MDAGNSDSDKPLLTQRQLWVRNVYHLAELDLPPSVNPTLHQLLEEGIGRPVIPASMMLNVPSVIDGRASTVDMFIVGFLPDPDIAIQITQSMSPRLADLDGYRLEMFSMLCDPETVIAYGSDNRLWTVTFTSPFEKTGLITLHIATIRRRAFWGNTDLYTELRWHPGLEEEDQHIRFGGLEHLSSDAASRRAELDRLHDAIWKLRGLPKQWGGGRPLEYDDARDAEFFEELSRIVHTTVRAGQAVTASSLARHWTRDRRTISAAVARFKYDLKALEAEALACTSGRSICTVHVRRRAEFKKNQV